MNKLFFDVSLVIPCYENYEVFKKVFNSRIAYWLILFILLLFLLFELNLIN